MTYYLFLDDKRQIYDVKWVSLPNDKPWIVARSYGEFVKTVLDLGLPAFVSFDHDLVEYHYKVSLEENKHPGLVYDYGSVKTGMDAVKWLVEYCLIHEKKFPGYVIHSLNEAAFERMEAYIKQAKRELEL